MLVLPSSDFFCFLEGKVNWAMGIIEDLSRTIEMRLKAAPEESYVASLNAKGTNKIIEKLSEETTEAILAAKDFDKSPESIKDITHEIADLWFHSMVLLGHFDIKPDEVLKELQSRFGQSGLTEKAKRASKENR